MKTSSRLALIVCLLVFGGCYTNTTLMLRNPDRNPAEKPVALDSEWATFEDTLAAAAEAGLGTVNPMPSGWVDEPIGGRWLYPLEESGRTTINRIFYDGDKEQELSGYLREGNVLHLLKAGDYSYSIGAIEINRIDSVEVLQRHRQQPKPAAIVVTSVFIGGVVLYLITADHEMQGYRHD